MKFITGPEPPARLSTQADKALIPRLQRLISRPEARGRFSAACLLYISRDRVSSLFHRVSSETLQATVSPGQGWLQYGEPTPVIPGKRPGGSRLPRLPVVDQGQLDTPTAGRGQG